METLSSRQMDMQKFIADGCREALLEEKRRFCFLADKHCMFSYQISNFHEKVRLVWGLVHWVLACLTEALCLQGQGDAVSEAPELAGKVLRYLQSAGHGDEHDWRTVRHSRPITSHWILQRGERLLLTPIPLPFVRCASLFPLIFISLPDKGCRFQNTNEWFISSHCSFSCSKASVWVLSGCVSERESYSCNRCLTAGWHTRLCLLMM